MSSDHFLIEAAEQGNTEEVMRLLALANPKYMNSEALWRAAWGGHTECVTLLIPVSETRAESTASPLYAAVAKNNVECVRLLLQVCAPSVRERVALCTAAERGFVQCVDLLLPHANIEAQCTALMLASANKHQDVFDTLYQSIGYERIKNQLHNNPIWNSERTMMISERMAFDERQLIKNSITQSAKDKQTRKI